MRRPLALLVVLAILTLACRQAPPAPTPPHEPGPPRVEGGHHLVGEAVATDPAVEAFLAPLRQQVEQAVGEVLGEAHSTIAKGGPESPLGNFVTDVMREAATRALGSPVHVAVTNNGGLRAPIPAGPVTRRTILEVMPFENRLLVVHMSGAQLRELAEQMAAQGGVPQSGLKLEIRKRALASVALTDGPIDPAGAYLIATTDYLANVGGKLSVLGRDPNARDLGLGLRAVLEQAVRERKVLAPVRDGRTRVLRKGE